MKSFTKLVSLLTLGALLAAANLARADQLDYSAISGAKISFDGASNFSFTNSLSSDHFQITSLGGANGLTGQILGTFTIGTVSAGTASVSGTGSFVIHDGASFDLVGTLVWLDMYQAGTGDGLNLNGNLNLTNITYAGANSVLQELATHAGATNVLTFQFGNTAVSDINYLKTHTVNTSFSGSVVAPDGGTTVMLLGAALAGLALIRRKRV